jgi:D-alanyl-D-alanine carboxypeptidase
MGRHRTSSLWVAALTLAMACKPSEAPKGAQGGGGRSAAGASAANSSAASRAGSAGADADLPARRFAAWLEAFNSADKAKILAYREENMTPEAVKAAGNVDGAVEFSNETGGFELKKVEESTAARHVVLLKERGSDQLARAQLEVEPAAPHRVQRFQINGIRTPEELSLKRMTEAEAIAALRAEIEKAVAADRFSGAVLIAKGGAPIFAEAYGLADREKKLPNKLDTRFRIGSMNKMFTAVATLQLVQAGKLALQDPLGKVLKDYPNQGVASKVTLHHMLTHTGGTGDIFGPEFDKHRLELRTLADYVKLYGARDLEHEPGARWQYSNYGFLLLGVVIERASGQSYYDRVAASIFKPAGMTGTASPPEDRPTPGRAVAYTRQGPGARWTSAADTLPYRGTSAGGGDSTVPDLLRFANALTSGKLLDAKHTALVTTGQVERPGGDKYAYGFADETSGDVRCFGHGGGAPGMNGQLSICDSGYTIAVLANLDPPAAGRLGNFITNRLPAK